MPTEKEIDEFVREQKKLGESLVVRNINQMIYFSLACVASFILGHYI